MAAAVSSRISIYRRPIHLGKRTNSLGWAKSDCHTCTSHGRQCDRRRPRCDACASEDVLCGGYALELKWQSSRQQSTVGFPHQSQDLMAPQLAVRFVNSLPKTAKTAKLPRRRSFAIVTQRPQAGGRLRVNCLPLLSRSVSPHSHLSMQSKELLKHFQVRFAQTTITYESKVNPWRACLPLAIDIPCLMDAAVALARRQQAHLQRVPEAIDVLVLKDRALTSFVSDMGTLSVEALISAVLLLIGLDYAETGYANWKIHLNGALDMLEARGGISSALQSSSVRGQLAMLIWYDTTAALFSLQGPVYPRSYIEALMACQSDAEWSVMSLNGCPDSMFVTMYDIARAAASIDSVSAGEIAALEVRLWMARPDAAGDKHLASLIDCWRLSLLLYCARVFHPDSATEKGKRIMLAEEVLWLVSDIPETLDLQKQCLLPVVVAGCEVDTPRFRRIATGFCSRWTDLIGIHIMVSTREFLRQIWDVMDEDTNGTAWWGNIIKMDGMKGFLFG